MKINNFFLIFVFILLLITVYKILLSPVLLQGGDYTSPTSQVFDIASNYFSWCNYVDLGHNCSAIVLRSSSLWAVMHFFFVVFNLNMFIIERIFWWFPFLLLSFFSSALLYRKIFCDSSFMFLSSILYSSNTYILMVVGGGQISGIGLAYAFFPLFLFVLINFFERQNLKHGIQLGLALSIFILFDPRLAYIALVAASLLFIWEIIFMENKWIFIRQVMLYLFIAGVIVLCFHGYWIIPALFFHSNPITALGSAYNSVDAVKYFSFSKFENAIALLHPNWPENIFGKVSFMRPEFLLLPLTAFSSLFFITQNRKKESFYILFFSFLALFGIFLGKGTNEPFGSVYELLFSYFPGFSLFRDSMKWYLLISLSYSMLIPFVLSRLSILLYEIYKRNYAK